MAALVSVAVLVFTSSPVQPRQEAPRQWPTSPPPVVVADTVPAISLSYPLTSTTIATVPTVEIEKPAPIESPSPPIEPAPIEQGMNQLSDAALYRLRMCESTDNYGAHLVWGTSYESRARGAYQFEQPTWDGVANRHFPWLVGIPPHHASPADQDAMARALFSERGRQPWPVCGRRI